MGDTGMYSLTARGDGRAYSRAIALIVFLLGMAVVLIGAPSRAFAMEAAVCTSCHSTTMDFSVADVNRDTACKACHLGFAGAHPMHQAGSNCAAACHPQWGDSLLTATPRYTDPISGAAFASASSKTTPAEELHIIHSAARWPAGVSASSSECASCHSAAACTACHTGAVTPVHGAHSAWGSAQMTARSPWSGTVGYGVVGGDQTQDTAFPDSNQCATVGCHNLVATTAARPRFIEDYNHAVGGNPDDPTAASTAISSTGTWRVRASTLYSGSRMTYNNVAGSTFTASFTGGRIELVSDKDPYRGQAEVLIDGAVVGTIDCYAPATLIQAVVFTRDVTQGSHTIMVRPTGLKHPAARGTFVVIDAFNVYPVSRGSLVPECDDCHVAQSTDHGARDAHAGGVMDPWCLGCHTELNLMTLHDAEPRGCIICHGTADATVKAAVLAGDKRCLTCHETPHATQHVNTWTTCAGVGCHNGTDLVGVHAPVGCGCHSSADSKVASAVGAGNKNCPACHNPMLQHGAVHQASPTYAVEVNFPGSTGTGTGGFVIKCLSCHRSNLLSNHGHDYTNCSMCHLAGGPRSSFTTWNTNCQTGACHPGTKAPHPPSHTVHYHNRMSIGIQPDGMCQSCHGNPVGQQCGTNFGCHTGAVPPVTSVDFTAPTTVASKGGTDSVRWDLLAVDTGDGVVATYYSFDGGPFALYGPTELANGITNPADGSPPYAHTLRFYSVDAAGNTEAIKTEIYDVTDITPPVVTFNGVGGAPVAKSIVMSASDPKVNGLSTGVAFIHVEVMAYNPYWGSWSISQWWPLADFSYALDGTWDTTRTVGDLQARAWARNSGNYYTYKDYGAGNGRFQIQYYARDYAGNQSAMTYADVWIDNGGPTTTAAKVSGLWRWKLTSYDNYGSSVAKTYYRFDGGAWTEYTAADVANGVGNPGGDTPGAHTMDYYSTDTLGNIEVTKTLNYSIP